MYSSQFQIAVYSGRCPDEIFEGTKPAWYILGRALKKGTCETLDYVQMIVRCGLEGGNQAYLTHWYPEINPSIINLILKDKSKLTKYVLHAKHSKIEKSENKLEAILGEDFEEILAQADSFFTN